MTEIIGACLISAFCIGSFYSGIRLGWRLRDSLALKEGSDSVPFTEVPLHDPLGYDLQGGAVPDFEPQEMIDDTEAFFVAYNAHLDAIGRPTWRSGENG